MRDDGMSYIGFLKLTLMSFISQILNFNYSIMNSGE